MDFDIPTDLINKAQIGFKQAAGLSSFDRKDTALPSISTVEASISSLDPSPSYLRCKFCQGKLLRGLQSLICVYCGENQKKDLHPEPISFSSTHGYSWLLQSLNFNGSERVGSLAEGSGIDGGHSPAEDELTLSELLDLKISWPDEPEKLENNLKIKTSEHNISLNLGATDFDQFFTKSMSKSAIVSDKLDQPVASKADQDKIVVGQENFASDWNAEFQFADTKMENAKPGSADLFEMAEADQNKIVEGQENFTSDWDTEFQFADTRMENEKPRSVDLFAGAEANLSANMDVGQEDLTSDWNAEFQFADTRMENEKTGSVDLFVGAEADLSAQMDVGFEQTESFDFKKPNDDSDPFQVDRFANMSSATFQQNEQLDAVAQSKDVLSGDINANDLKNVDGNWFSDGNWQKSNVKATLNDGSLQDNPNDSITDWFDNTNWQKDGTTNNAATIKDDNYTLNDGSLQDNPNDSLTDWFENTNWQKSSANNMTTIKDDNYTLNDGSLQNKPNNTSTDLFETTNWQKDSTNNNTATIQDDNIFDIKPKAKDLIQPERSDLDVKDWFQNSQWAVGGSSSATNIAVSKDDDDDDGFGDWNDFTSSTGNKDSFQASWKESGNEKVDFGTSEKMSELDLFQTTVASSEVDFGNFLQSDIFSGDKSRNDTPAVDDIFSEVSTAIRSANAEAGNNVEGSVISKEAKNDEITPNATTSPRDDVQMLMSQMHDLSFMLKNELSVPSKPDDVGTSHS